MSLADHRRAAELALGRIFRMGARPSQPGDADMFERCRAVILEAADAGAIPAPGRSWSPDYTRDRHRGAQGD